MIYDLGCLDQLDLWQKTGAALPGAMAVFALVVGLAVMGAFLSRSPRFYAHDIFAGWGFVAAVMTLAAVSIPKALPFATLALFILMIFAAVPAFKRRYLGAPFWLLALFPGLFILAAINIAGIAKWDDFSHWVPNALYLFRNDGVPGHGLPAPTSFVPTYPYALPFLTYMASWLAGGFLVQGGAMINFFLLIAFASMLAEIPEAPEVHALNLGSVGKIALALVIVTIANPAFNASFTVTSQGDTGTMVLTAALGLLLTDKRAKMTPAIALIGMALVLIKQSNMVLLVLLLGGSLIVALKNRRVKPALMQAIIVFLPALAMRMIWEFYVNAEMGGNIVTLHTLGAWRFDLLGPLLHAMLQEMVKKNGLTILMVCVTGYGVAGLFRPSTPLRDLALMSGIVYVGYLAFLTMIYIGASFTENEVRRAASFYRYTTHTGLLGISAAWMAAPALWQRVKGKIPPLSRTAHAAIVCLLIAPLPAIILIDGDIVVPQPTKEMCTIRVFGRKLAGVLPDHARLAVLEPESDGLFSFMINFDLDLQATQTKKDFALTWYINRSGDSLKKEAFVPGKMPEYMSRIDQSPDINTIIIAPGVELAIKGNDYGQAPLVLEREVTGWKPLMP